MTPPVSGASIISSHPGLSTHQQHNSSNPTSPTLSDSSAESPPTHIQGAERELVTPRPRLGTRKSSGTIIVPRDAKVELSRDEEVFDEDDARAMSPRRNSEDLEKMGQEARAQLNQ
jgi:hypothetical protein